MEIDVYNTKGRVSEKCPICKGEEYSIASTTIRGGVQCDVRHCKKCTVYYLPPGFADSDKLIQEYSTNYTYKPSLGSLLGTDYDPYLAYVSYIDHLLDKKTTSLLDIGAGPGHFISHVKDRVLNVEAVELHPGQADYCRKTHNITVHEDLISALDMTEKFDIVCAFSVLEHVPDPVDFLTKAMSFVKPGGVLFIEVPNSQDPLLSLYDVPNYSNFYFRPEHLYDFNKQSLAKLFETAGFRNHTLDLHQAYSLTNHIHWATNGKGQESTKVGYRFTFPSPPKSPSPLADRLQEFFDDIDRQYRDFLKKEGYADMLLSIVEKP